VKPKLQATCVVRGVLAPGGMCGKIIVGGKFCGHDGPCEHKRMTMEKASPEILTVHVVTKDGGDYCVKCPHCGDFIGIEGDDLSEIRGEQYQHKRCGGWLEVSASARFARTTGATNDQRT
jgi:hypothetical protein